jgi:hypothetical protein
LTLAAVALAACSSGNDNITTPSSISVALSPSTASVPQGASTPATVTITRTSFTGDVQLSAENLPAGVTATFSPATLSGSATSSTVTLAATAAATPATGTTITVRAKGTGVTDATSTLSLTVAAAPAYTLTLASPAISIAQGASGTVTVALARTNFTGDVSLSVSGLPTGATASFNPAVVSTTSSVLTIATGTAAVGTYNLTITGTATGSADRTTPLTLTISAPLPGTNVVFRFCDDALPTWVAYQDGTGAWTRASIGAGTSYSFSIGAKGGVAWVIPRSGNAATNGYDTHIVYGTGAQLQAYGNTNCTFPISGTKIVNGSVAGLGTTTTAAVALGDVQRSGITAPPATFTLDSVLDGARDLIASRTPVGGVFDPPNKLIIRRNQNPANGSTMSVLDFEGTESFAPVSSSLSLPGVSASASTIVFAGFTTANGTSESFGFAPTTAGAASYLGVPSSKTIASDLHDLIVLVQESPTATAYRAGITFFANVGARSLTLGPALTAPIVSSVATSPYPRLKAEAASQATYGAFYTVDFQQANASAPASPTDRSVTIEATSAYFDGTPVTWSLTIPDLSAAAGFSSAWMLASGRSTDVIAQAAGGDLLAAPVDGTTIYLASATATTTTSPSMMAGGRMRLTASPRQSRSVLAAQAQRIRSMPVSLRFARGR